MGFPSLSAALILVLAAVTTISSCNYSADQTELAVDSGSVESLAVDLPNAAELIQLLRDRGIKVRSVRGSTCAALFDGTDQAVWVETEQGIVEAVIFPDRESAKRVLVQRRSDGDRRRYRYTVRETPNGPARTINANRPLYFVTHERMLISTVARPIEKAIRQSVD